MLLTQLLWHLVLKARSQCVVCDHLTLPFIWDSSINYLLSVICNPPTWRKLISTTSLLHKFFRPRNKLCNYHWTDLILKMLWFLPCCILFHSLLQSAKITTRVSMPHCSFFFIFKKFSLSQGNSLWHLQAHQFILPVITQSNFWCISLH